MVKWIALVFAVGLSIFAAQAGMASTEGSISGTVDGPSGQPEAGIAVELHHSDGRVLTKTTTDAEGNYQFTNVQFGDYEVTTKGKGTKTSKVGVHVTSGASTVADVTLVPASTKNDVVVVGTKMASTASSSVVEINKQAIETMPQGDNISLPRLLATTTPGVVQGPFGQTFIRGNHANIQYQIDGVQLPDSPSNTFGDAISPRNIDHMEVFTGGIPAEYGERLSAVVNVITKSGAQEPSATVGLSYGSYKTFTPAVELSGSTKDGSFRYYVSGSYTSTDRGLDTPQPASESNQRQGGTDAIHDQANNDNELVKLDWIGATNTLTFVGSNTRQYYQIPNYPESFKPTDPFFQPTYVDQFGNTPGFNYVPSNTNDTQTERNRYAEIVWRHTVSDQTYFQLAPYWKSSTIEVTNDPANDLAAITLIPGSTPSSFAEDRTTNNYGFKGDYSTHIGTANHVKTGFQVQTARSTGPISVTAANSTPPPATVSSNVSDADLGTFEGVYVQDDLTLTKWLTLNFGLRFDATQFKFADVAPRDQLLQPRLGASFQLTDSTKLHLFYGKLFQPAPVEDLRETFLSVGNGQLGPYDIKAEKDDYYEGGITQSIGNQTLSVTEWGKNAKNMLDDTQLLNTSIAQPYNYAVGFAYGTDVSLSGNITDNWQDFVTYSYEIAKGKGLSGGLFTFPSGQQPGDVWLYLDHMQMNTANAGVKYEKSGLWWTFMANYGSGLRTGPNNTKSLPSHTTGDTTLGYGFEKSQGLMSGVKVSADIINITDNRYPITIANGFNGSHYDAGREYFLHLSKDI